MDYCFYELQKNIVIVFHATEEKDGDNTRLRIKVEGQTKNNVWEPMDLGGFVEIYGNDAPSVLQLREVFRQGDAAVSPAFARSPRSARPARTIFLTKLFCRVQRQGHCRGRAERC